MSRFRSAALFALCLFVASLATAQTFTTATYSVGSNARKLIRADFNGDGYQDIATANGDGTVTILLNNGNGTFRRLDAVAGVSGTTILDISAADVNKDGKQDLLVVDSLTNRSSNLNLLTGRGDGTFAAPVTIAVKYGGVAIAAADFNGDGNIDVAYGFNVTSTTTNVVNANVTIYYGNGSGGFPTHTDLTNLGAQADYANGENGYQIRYMNVGDFNKDGKQDFAIAECCGGFDVELGSAYVYTNNGSGNTFTGHQLYASIPLELRVGDIDKDGITDLLIPYLGCHTPCHGVTTFRTPATNPQGVDVPDPFGSNGFSEDYGASATVADFTGSGVNQVAYTAWGYFYNDATSTDETLIAFASANTSGGYTINSTFNAGPEQLSWLTYADWNKDGKNDLAAISMPDVTGAANQVMVFINKGGTSGGCSASSNRTVVICAPAAGAQEPSPVQVMAALRSDSGITAAQIYVDGVKVYQGPSGTTSINQSLTMGTGTHKITVKGWDSTGSFSSSTSITVTGSTTTSCSTSANRTVKICTPTPGGTFQSAVHVLAGLRSDSGISSAQIYLDGTKVYQGPSGTKTVDQYVSMAPGSHKISVKGWDTSGSFSSSVTFNSI